MLELQGKALRRLNKHAFERFCRRLLDQEYEQRFAPQAVELEGGEEDVADGGRDLRAIVRRATKEASHWSLLPDEPADVWYSCKTHKDDGRSKDPGGWRAQVRNDLDPSPRIVDGRSGQLVPRADEIANGDDKRPPPRDLLDALANGGRYVVLVNVNAERKVELEDELRTLFEFWIRRELEREVELDDDAVRVRDASYLARVYNTRPFSLPSEWLDQLEIDEPDHLHDWNRWTRTYTSDRRDMTWQPDARRQGLVIRLQTFVNSEQSHAVFRIWGPPGVGKTRLVHQALSDASVDTRVRYSEDVLGVRTWLAKSRSQLAHDLILIIDEVPATDVTSLKKDFEHHAPANAKLILIGPQESGHQGGPEPELLDRLDDQQTRAILVAEMAANDSRIDLALELCRGYPLFAYWLGNALANDPELLGDPRAALTDDEDPWVAASAVMVGPRRGDEDSWRTKALDRGKALVAVSLTTDLPWSQLSDQGRQSLADALELPWSALESAARECEQRSLVRRRGELRYVSPANLERLVLNHFFSDGPGGPPLDPKRMARLLLNSFAKLLGRAHAVHASDSCKRNLAKGALRLLESEEDLDRLRHYLSLLVSSSHAAPTDALDTIEALIDGVGAQLGKGLGSGSLIQSLRHLSHRQLSWRDFERVEALLLTLALNEPNGIGEGARIARPVPRAQRAWAPLFHPFGHLTRQPFEARFELLVKRAHNEDPSTRALAIEALGRGLGSSGEGYGSGWDDIDGPWEHQLPPSPDYGARRRQLWPALIDACSDSAPSVRSRARELVALLLRSGLQGQLHPPCIEQIAEQAPSWSLDERERLAEQVDEVTRFDLDKLTPGSPRRQAFERLRAVVQPHQLEERIVAQVGRWFPGSMPLDAEHRGTLEREADLALARELASDRELLGSMLPWLRSTKAVRGRVFASALGHSDPAMELFELLDPTDADVPASHFAAAYLEGWLEVVDDQTFDTWLAEVGRDRSSLLLARVLTLVPTNDFRTQLLVEQFDRAQIPAQAVAGFGHNSRWAETFTTESLERLIERLARPDVTQLATEAVGLVAVRLQGSQTLSDSLRAAAHEILDQQPDSLPSIVARSWWRSVFALVSHGDLQPLRAALERAKHSNKYPHHLVSALRELDGPELSESLWPVVAESLTTAADEHELGWMLRLLANSGYLDGVTPALVLEWTGDSTARGQAIARAISPLWSPSELGRQLISHFGAESDVAASLDPAEGLFEFDAWLDSDDLEVRRWSAARMRQPKLLSASGS